MRAGQIRGLGVTGLKRDPAAPELPPIAETLPGYEVMAWQGMFVPAKTPSEIVKKINMRRPCRSHRSHGQGQGAS